MQTLGDKKTLLSTLSSISSFMVQEQRSRYTEYFHQGGNQLLFNLELEHRLLTHLVLAIAVIEGEQCSEH